MERAEVFRCLSGEQVVRFKVTGVSIRDVIVKRTYGAIFSSDRRLVGPLGRVRRIG